MAADAKVQKVEELAAYSNHLGGFIESMSKNFISFNNVMMQKLEELRKKLRKAEEMCAEATTECSQCERDLAYCSSDNNEVKRNLKIRLDYAINKRLDAQQMRSLVSSQYNVAQGVLRCMLDDTQVIQKKLRDDIAKGRQLLKNASIQLEQYKDNSKNV
ncbi:MAG: hypothetical protein IKK62_07920 [Bacteroidaceae bacterium]|nr:hypothetical protein [Bacteroidaceae bacterium]